MNLIGKRMMYAFPFVHRCMDREKGRSKFNQPLSEVPIIPVIIRCAVLLLSDVDGQWRSHASEGVAHCGCWS